MSCRLVSLGIALFLVVCILHASNAASLKKRPHDIAEGRSLRSVVARAYRQSANDDPAYEESDEDDDEYDAEQAQQEIVRNQQVQEESQEDSEEEDIDDDIRRRRRRDVAVEETVAPVIAPAPESVEAVKPEEDKKEDDKKEDDKKEEEAVAAATPIPVKKQPSVLILIRDALKKVTTELPQPTQQVATSALQYFQLFEHFLQQTIEQVIGDDDDDEEEATTVKAELEAANVEDSDNKAPAAVEAPMPIPAPEAPIPVPAPVAVVEEVAQVAALENLKPAVVPEQVDVPKKDVVVSEAVASNKV